MNKHRGKRMARTAPLVLLLATCGACGVFAVEVQTRFVPQVTDAL